MRRIISLKSCLRTLKGGQGTETEIVGIVEDKENNEIYVRHTLSGITSYVDTLEEAEEIAMLIFGKNVLEYQKENFDENKPASMIRDHRYLKGTLGELNEHGN